MTIREQTQQLERQTLAPWAAFSQETRGRQRPEEECEMRTPYQRDRDRIIHCKSFRRLKHKTQVFLSPEGDHYRTRLTHTLEVAQIARTIARALRLNEDLTEAVALAHDLGHTPFGHAGERALNALLPHGFRHYEQSLRVVERLEKDGQGPEPHLRGAQRRAVPHHRLRGRHRRRAASSAGRTKSPTSTTTSTTPSGPASCGRRISPGPSPRCWGIPRQSASPPSSARW